MMYRVLLLIGLMVTWTLPMAAEPLFLEKSGTWSTEGHLRYLEDRDKNLTLDTLPAYDNPLWSVSKAPTPNFGYSNSAWWFALKLANTSSSSLEHLVEVSYPLLDSLDFYWQVDGQWVNQLKTGDQVPFHHRQIAHRNLLFPLTLPAQSEGLLILRVDTSSAVQLPIRIIDAETFQVNDQYALSGQMLYFGMMLVMILFNGFLYLSLRESGYLYYILFVTCFALVQACLHGLPNQFVFTDEPWLQDKLLLIAIPGIVLFASLFTRDFLTLREHAPHFDKFFLVMATYAALLVFAGLFASYQQAILFSIIGVLPASLGCLIIGPVVWRKGHQIARFYTLAWLSITIAAFLLALNKMGILPRNFFTENGLQIGSAIEAILLSLALADRLNTEREARFRAQQKMLEETRARHLIESRLIHDALHVPLTGLPNRSFMEKWFREREQSGQMAGRVGLGLIFLSRFHEVNKTLGHEKADQLLKQLTRAINEQSLDLPGVVLLEDGAAMAAVAAVEGVTFGMLFEDQDTREIKASLSRVTALLAEPFEFDNMMIDVGGVAGIAMKPDHADNLPMLIRNAQIAIDMGLRSGKLLSLYSDEINPYSPRRLGLAGELRRALREGELYLVFQPKVMAGTGQPMGTEALLRWEHAQHGFVSPDEFIPIAEQTGIIHSLTEWVLDAAISAVAEMKKRGYPLGVSINISAVNLREKDLAKRLQHTLEKHDIAPGEVTLEVTETAVMDDPEHALLILNQLNDIGVRLSIDDFGTGYSSLAYLKRMPVREIKIDRSFVMHMDNDRGDTIIVKTTVNMCHDLGMQVVAEGVETDASREQLRAFGCDYLQGYLLSKPLKFPALIDWLDEHSRGQV